MQNYGASAERLKDYLLRLRTTSISAPKYGETINIISELLRAEIET